MKSLAKWRLMFLVTLAALVLSGCGKPFLSTLQPAGEVAKTQYDLMLLSTAIMLGVIIVVSVIFVIAIIRFRRKDDKIPKQVEGSHKLEIIWTVIPILLLLILAVPTVSATFKLADVDAMDVKNEEGKTDALVVNVRANLYWWEFEYPNEGIITGQELVVPTDEKVYFNLKASDVKHSFWIPAVGGKMDTNTDNINKFWLEFDSTKTNEAGDIFYGKCAELCGPSHALMDFKVKAVPRAEFDQWIAGMQGVKEPAVPDTATAKAGQDLFNESCIGCHAVTPSNATPEAARLAPNLTNFGDREYVAGVLKHSPENIKNWLKDPETFKPANKMTGTYRDDNGDGMTDLSDEELNALTEYLMSLKVQK